MSQRISLLGATGSIGTQTLDVIEHHPEQFQLVTLSGGKNLHRLAEQVAQFEPEAVCIQSAEDIPLFQDYLKALAPHFKGQVLCGKEGLSTLATWPSVDTVVVGLVGLVGLAPSLAALKAGKKLATANKETFVTGGHLVKPYLSQIIPVDSEHVAIHQCLKQESASTVAKLYLTASGGPFRTFSKAEMAQVTLEQALKHPNWVMGQKITIDSATMMNKGLEVIEAHWLFNLPYERIQVVVHPESLIHSGVAFIDGSILLQMGGADMRGPIQYALTYPERLQTPFQSVPLDLLSINQLHLETPDLDRFPCIQLAYEAGRLGGSATTVLNGADEMAVSLFLKNQIQYQDIPRLLTDVLALHQTEGVQPSPTLSEIQTLDTWARKQVQRLSLTSSLTQ